MSFHKYSRFIGCLVYCFPSVCIGWTFAVLLVQPGRLEFTKLSLSATNIVFAKLYASTLTEEINFPPHLSQGHWS
jgi:hypothetical protein